MTKKDRRTSYCLVFKTQYEAGKKKNGKALKCCAGVCGNVSSIQKRWGTKVGLFVSSEGLSNLPSFKFLPGTPWQLGHGIVPARVTLHFGASILK